MASPFLGAPFPSAVLVPPNSFCLRTNNMRLQSRSRGFLEVSRVPSLVVLSGHRTDTTDVLRGGCALDFALVSSCLPSYKPSSAKAGAWASTDTTPPQPAALAAQHSRPTAPGASLKEGRFH